jgi:hypothetical protein
MFPAAMVRPATEPTLNGGGRKTVGATEPFNRVFHCHSSITSMGCPLCRWVGVFSRSAVFEDEDMPGESALDMV